MPNQQTPQDVHPESPYYPWASLVIEICDDEDFYPVEVIRRFWDRYTLPESTLPLYQLLMASKGGAAQGKELSRPTGAEAPDTYFRDLCEAIVAFAYLTRHAPEQIIFVKPQTTESDAKR